MKGSDSANSWGLQLDGLGLKDVDMSEFGACDKVEGVKASQWASRGHAVHGSQQNHHWLPAGGAVSPWSMQWVKRSGRQS